ncbi:MAG: hypothetical protein JRM99_05255 [Nitrososphaerota archaeon]|nr:hypothetical protein [Nitrososphaerota archaeon]
MTVNIPEIGSTRFSRTSRWFFCEYEITENSIMRIGLVPTWVFVGLILSVYIILELVSDFGAIANAIAGVLIAYPICYVTASFSRGKNRISGTPHFDSKKSKTIDWSSIRGIRIGSGTAVLVLDKGGFSVNITPSELSVLQSWAQRKGVPTIQSFPSALVVKVLSFFGYYGIILVFGLVFLQPYPVLELDALFAVMLSSVASMIVLVRVGHQIGRVPRLFSSGLGGIAAAWAIILDLPVVVPFGSVLAVASALGVATGIAVAYLERPRTRLIGP